MAFISRKLLGNVKSNFLHKCFHRVKIISTCLWSVRKCTPSRMILLLVRRKTLPKHQVWSQIKSLERAKDAKSQLTNNSAHQTWLVKFSMANTKKPPKWKHQLKCRKLQRSLSLSQAAKPKQWSKRCWPRTTSQHKTVLFSTTKSMHPCKLSILWSRAFLRIASPPLWKLSVEANTLFLQRLRKITWRALALAPAAFHSAWTRERTLTKSKWTSQKWASKWRNSRKTHARDQI